MTLSPGDVDMQFIQALRGANVEELNLIWETVHAAPHEVPDWVHVALERAYRRLLGE